MNEKAGKIISFDDGLFNKYSLENLDNELEKVNFSMSIHLNFYAVVLRRCVNSGIFSEETARNKLMKRVARFQDECASMIKNCVEVFEK